ncbi:MAG: cereblon family protein [Pseudomonadales bacterium]
MIDVVDKQRQGTGLDPGLEDILEDEALDRGALVFCGICSHVIGRRSDAIEVNGSHSHQCVNPYGIRFDVTCYAEALGCTISGQPSAADTWFAGFRWRLATCGDCGAHLGWYFDRNSEYFYGLIRDRIQHE